MPISSSSGTSTAASSTSGIVSTAISDVVHNFTPVVAIADTHDEFVEAVRAHPKSAKAHTYLGNHYLFNEKNWSAALHEFESAVQLEPAYMLAWFRIGQHAAASGSNYARGEEALRRYLAYTPSQNEPGHAGAWMTLGSIQEKQGKKTEAKTSYTNALKLVPNDKGVREALKRVS